MGQAAFRVVEEVFARPPIRLVIVSSPSRTDFNPKRRAEEVRTTVEGYVRQMDSWLVDIKSAAEVILSSEDRLATINLRTTAIHFVQFWESDEGFAHDVRQRIEAVEVFDKEVKKRRLPSWKLLVSANNKVIQALELAISARDSFGNCIKKTVIDRCDDWLLQDGKQVRNIHEMFEDIAMRYPVVTSYLGR